MDPPRLPPQTSMGPVHLRVRDLDLALDYYEGMLGMRALEKRPEGAVLGSDHPILRLTGDPDAPRRALRTTGLYHVAILLPTRADLARILEHFSAFRQPLDGAADHLVSEALYMSDPEGNGIEVYADRPRSGWRWEDGKLQMSTTAIDIAGLLAEAGDEEWKGMPDGTRVGHVHLNVGDVPAAERFYRDLGFDLTTRYGAEASFLSAGGYHHHLAVNGWAGRGAAPPPPGSAGLVEYVVRVGDDAALDRLGDRLPKARREGRDVVVEDPSRNVVRLVA